jgi:hypothetical protein
MAEYNRKIIRTKIGLLTPIFVMSTPRLAPPLDHFHFHDHYFHLHHYYYN